MEKTFHFYISDINHTTLYIPSFQASEHRFIFRQNTTFREPHSRSFAICNPYQLMMWGVNIQLFLIYIHPHFQTDHRETIINIQTERRKLSLGCKSCSCSDLLHHFPSLLCLDLCLTMLREKKTYILFNISDAIFLGVLIKFSEEGQ